MLELTYQGAAILGVVVAAAWVVIWWTDRRS
jgi:hypothetical protein